MRPPDVCCCLCRVRVCLQQKNVGGDMLQGKVGRIYMPKQSFDSLGLVKMKGLKRERRQAAAARAAAAAEGGSGSGSSKRQRTAATGAGSDR